MAKKKSFLKRQLIKVQESWADGIETPIQRLLAHIDSNLGDHGFLRILWTNQHQIDSMVWRSNQPTPRRIGRLTKKGISTIVNLRGKNRWGSYILEKEACEKHGIRLINHRMFSYKMPTIEELIKIKAMFEALDGKTLFHCKAGADRAGFCSALYLLIVKDAPIAEAQKHLSGRYLHFRYSKAGRLSYFLNCYKAFNEKEPIAFMDWCENHYDREKLTEEFKSNKWYDFIVDKVLKRE
jgi:protein tyrosine phosphatase (PTP) superfamily phosphohydrolase (DUF442 family)